MTRALMSLRGLLAPALGVALLACHASFSSSAPRGFVELDPTERYDFRATSADGLVLAARQLDNDPQAELSFWTRAVENAMRTRGGYALLETRDVQVAGGLRAKQLRFGHDEASQPHLYYVTLVVTCSAIYVLEAGGTKPLIEQHTPEIETWLHTFRPQRCAPFPLSPLCTPVTSK